MTTNELRIGNLVLNEDGVLHEINALYSTSITSRRSSVAEPFENAHIRRYSPIPLTEDWLVALGFSNLGYGEFELGNYMADGEYTDENEYEFCYLGNRICTIYFVHQLQNLYFCLTGTELEIKL